MPDRLSDQSQPISRRGLFQALARPFARIAANATSPSEAEAAVSVPAQEGVLREAVIQGRFCLAYDGGMCFTCSEQCPEPGAITTKNGIPTVHADLCTGCGVCHDLCPAPRNAILMLERKKVSDGRI